MGPRKGRKKRHNKARREGRGKGRKKRHRGATVGGLREGKSRGGTGEKRREVLKLRDGEREGEG